VSGTSMGMTSLVAAVLMLAGCAQSTESTQEGAAAYTNPPAQQRASAPSTLTVPDGTLVEVSLNSTLNSGTSQVGDNFTAEVTEDVMVDDRRAIPAGSTVHGTVQAVTPAKRGAGNASLSLGFNRLDLPGGYSTTVVAGLTERTASKKKRNAGIIGGSAAGGAILGRIIGKDTKGAVAGAVIGGGIGTGVVMTKPGVQVNLPAGAELTIQLESAVKVPRR